MRNRIVAALPVREYHRARWIRFRLAHPDRYASNQSLREGKSPQGYSYKQFDEHRCIFVHVPKCAGIAISEALFQNRSGGHTTFNEYINVFPPRVLESYFKFAFVRNPFDRLVSSFHFLKRGGFGRRDSEWAEANLGKYQEFGEFVGDWLDRDTIYRWQHFRPQHHYLLERRDKIVLDFIGRFENLESDFSHIAEQLGMDCHLSSMNDSGHSDYTSYYDDRTRAIVSDVYKEDIELFGYSFDNSGLQPIHRKSSGA